MTKSWTALSIEERLALSRAASEDTMRHVRDVMLPSMRLARERGRQKLLAMRQHMTEEEWLQGDYDKIGSWQNWETGE